MPVKQATLPDGRRIKFGRLVSDPHSKKLHFHNYSGRLPDPPPSCDFSAKATKSMIDIFLNDSEGDCVVADNNHGLGIVTGNRGSEFVATSASINAEYRAIGGYNGTPQTDNGCDPEVALRYYATTGYSNGTKLVAWMAVDPANVTLVKQAIAELENAAIAINLPLEYTNPFPSGDGFLWDVAGPPDPYQGHEFIAYGYTSQGVLINSWAMKGVMTWPALAKYAATNAQGAMYLRLFDAMFDPQGMSAGGMSKIQVVTDFNQMGGNVPIPVNPPPVNPPQPPPPPPPRPVPPGPPPKPVSLVNVDLSNEIVTIASNAVRMITSHDGNIHINPRNSVVQVPRGWTVHNLTARFEEDEVRDAALSAGPIPTLIAILERIELAILDPSTAAVELAILKAIAPHVEAGHPCAKAILDAAIAKLQAVVGGGTATQGAPGHRPRPRPRPRPFADPEPGDGCCQLLQQMLRYLFGPFAPTVDPANTDCCSVIGEIIKIISTPLGPIVTMSDALDTLETEATISQLTAVADYLTSIGLGSLYQPIDPGGTGGP